MFKNRYTDYLEEQGWRQTVPMTFTREGTDRQIFFDTGNSIEVYATGGLLKTAYLQEKGDIVTVPNGLA